MGNVLKEVKKLPTRMIKLMEQSDYGEVKLMYDGDFGGSKRLGHATKIHNSVI